MRYKGKVGQSVYGVHVRQNGRLIRGEQITLSLSNETFENKSPLSFYCPCHAEVASVSCFVQKLLAFPVLCDLSGQTD